MALFVASVVTILHHLGWLGGLDALSLRLADTAFGMEGNWGLNREMDIEGPGAVPKVVVITEALYETAFRQRSPLDRHTLTLILDRLFPLVEGRDCTDPRAPGLFRNLPGVLVMDLDLSPDPPASPGDVARGDNGGNATLGALLRCLAGQTDLVLAQPFALFLHEARESKVQWQQELCKQGAWFAQPYIASNFGTAMRMDNAAHTLGRVAYEIDTGRRGPGPVPKHPLKTRNPAKPVPCDSLFAGASDFLGLDPDGNENEKKKEEEGNALNFRFARALNPYRIDKLDDLRTPPRFSRGDVVFLGGDFGPGDRYITPAGNLDGVYLHAGEFYTQYHPVTPWVHLFRFWLDVGAGLLAGLVFTCIHGRYVNRENVWNRTRTECAALCACCLLFVNLAAPVFATIVLLAMTAYLAVWHNVWIHPIAMVVGMFIHSNLIRTPPEFDHENGPEAGFHAKADGRPSVWSRAVGWLRAVRPWSSWVLLAGVVGVIGLAGFMVIDDTVVDVRAALSHIAPVQTSVG